MNDELLKRYMDLLNKLFEWQFEESDIVFIQAYGCTIQYGTEPRICTVDINPGRKYKHYFYIRIDVTNDYYSIAYKPDFENKLKLSTLKEVMEYLQEAP